MTLKRQLGIKPDLKSSRKITQNTSRLSRHSHLSLKFMQQSHLLCSQTLTKLKEMFWNSMLSTKSSQKSSLNSLRLLRESKLLIFGSSWMVIIQKNKRHGPKRFNIMALLLMDSIMVINVWQKAFWKLSLLLLKRLKVQ